MADPVPAPTPVGLSEEDQSCVYRAEGWVSTLTENSPSRCCILDLLAIIDRLSAPDRPRRPTMATDDTRVALEILWPTRFIWVRRCLDRAVNWLAVNRPRQVDRRFGLTTFVFDRLDDLRLSLARRAARHRPSPVSSDSEEGDDA